MFMPHVDDVEAFLSQLSLFAVFSMTRTLQANLIFCNLHFLFIYFFCLNSHLVVSSFLNVAFCYQILQLPWASSFSKYNFILWAPRVLHAVCWLEVVSDIITTVLSQVPIKNDPKTCCGI